MVGIYFSGTGNTKHYIKQFVNEIDCSARCMSIEETNVVSEIQKSVTVILAYPIYYSNLPKIVHDFIMKNHTAFKGKNIFVIATMGLFSGDGAGCAARILAKHDAYITGGLHVKMPDCSGVYCIR